MYAHLTPEKTTFYGCNVLSHTLSLFNHSLNKTNMHTPIMFHMYEQFTASCETSGISKNACFQFLFQRLK